MIRSWFHPSKHAIQVNYDLTHPVEASPVNVEAFGRAQRHRVLILEESGWMQFSGLMAQVEHDMTAVMQVLTDNTVTHALDYQDHLVAWFWRCE